MNDNQSICDDDLIFDQVDLYERDETNELLGKIQELSGDAELLEVITQLFSIVVKQSKEIKIKAKGGSIGIWEKDHTKSERFLRCIRKSRRSWEVLL